LTIKKERRTYQSRNDRGVAASRRGVRSFYIFRRNGQRTVSKDDGNLSWLARARRCPSRNNRCSALRGWRMMAVRQNPLHLSWPGCHETDMKQRIQKAAVLGAGTMGARIAAHLANAGIPCLLLDIAAEGDPRFRNSIVQAGLDAARKSRPAAFSPPTPAGSSRPAILKMTSRDFRKSTGSSKPSPKIWRSNAIYSRALSNFEKPAPSSAAIRPACPSTPLPTGFLRDFQQHWTGTHFFNPPRYIEAGGNYSRAAYPPRGDRCSR